MLNELPNRPYPPEVTAKRFSDAVDMYASFITQSTDRNMVAVNLEACFAGNPNAKAMRKAVMQYLVGKTSTKDLTDGETIAFKKWLNARPDTAGLGKWVPDINTMQEAIQINAIALKNEGQQELTMTNDMPVVPELDDLDDEVKITTLPQPIPTHIINNTNQQAGAEWNLFYYDPSGFDCHLKLHASNGLYALDLAAAAMLKLVERGCTPKNGAPRSTAEPARENLPADGSASSTYCTIHQSNMERKENEHGVWYSHKTDDPAYADKKGWCNGKPRS